MLLLLLGCVLQLREAVLPEIAQEGAQLGQSLRPGAIVATGAGSSLFDQAGLAQHAQVLGHGRPGDIWEVGGDFTRGVFAIADKAQDGDAARLAEGVEEGGVSQGR